LIDRDLRGVLREGLFEAVAFQCAPVLGVDGLAFPNQGENQIDARQVGAVNDDAISVSAQRTICRGERKRLRWCKLETSRDEMLTRTLLEIMPTIENFARSGRELRLAPPCILNATRAFVPDDRCA